MLIRKLAVFCGLFVILLNVLSAETRSVVPAVGKPQLIIDTDIGNSMDDLFAIELGVRLDAAQHMDLLAVMIDRAVTANDPAPNKITDFVEKLLHYYDRDNVHIGTISPKKPGQNEGKVFFPYYELATMKDKDGKDMMAPLDKPRTGKVEDAVKLYRELLANAEDGSIYICQIGFLTHLMGLLDSPADDFSPMTGRELIAAKVRKLLIMAGCFDGCLDHPEYNVLGDIASAKRVFNEWPTEIYCSPYEIGIRIYYPTYAVLEDFQDNQTHPINLAYAFYNPDSPEHGRKTQLNWDDMTVLSLMDEYEGLGFFDSSTFGKVTVDDEGYTTFQAVDGGNTRIQQITMENVRRIRKYIRTSFSSKSEPPSEHGENHPLRISAICAAPKIGDSEYITLRNTSSKNTIDLTGYFLVVAPPETTPQLCIDLPARTLAPGEEVTLTQEKYWPDTELENAALNVLLYGANQQLVQEMYLDSRWENGAYLQTGRPMVPADFSDIVLDKVQWTSSEQRYTCTIQLKAGWQLVAIPLVLTEESTTKLQALSPFTHSPSQGTYCPATSFTPNTAYFIHTNEDTVLELTGTLPATLTPAQE